MIDVVFSHIFFVKILDFITMEEARANVEVDKHERGFRKIAWAFLKVIHSVWSFREKRPICMFYCFF